MESIMGSLAMTGKDEKLSEDELACALYKGMPHLQNLAEKLARQHGKAGVLSFYDLMGTGVQAFWKSIARQLIDHSKHWLVNDPSGRCCLDHEETVRLEELASKT